LFDSSEEDHVAIIREIRPSESPSVTELYLDFSREIADRDPESEVVESGPIERWIGRTTDTDDAVCLVAEGSASLAGFVLASVQRHPAMPGAVAELEALYVRPSPDRETVERQLVDAGIAWARDREAGVVVTKVAVDAFTPQEIERWGAFGFEHTAAELRRYLNEDEPC
jgi:GNAT superfamily N-acetyltransferase